MCQFSYYFIEPRASWIVSNVADRLTKYHFETCRSGIEKTLNTLFSNTENEEGNSFDLSQVDKAEDQISSFVNELFSVILV